MYKIDSLENAVRELYYSGIAGADYEDVDQTCYNGDVLTGRTYELWLLEDMSLVSVACVSLACDSENFITQYREVSGERGWPWDSGLCLSLEDLTENLLEMCLPCGECNMPVYEL